MAHLLIIDDEPVITRSLGNFLEKTGNHTVTRAHSGQEGIDRFIESSPDLVLLDLSMPDLTGFEVMDALKAYNPLVIVITGSGDVPMAVEAIRRGAENFIQKPLDLHFISSAIDEALQNAEIRSSLKKLTEEQSAYNPLTLHSVLLGDSSIMAELRSQIDQLAQQPNSAGLIVGEVGTGKTRIAHLVHQLSCRSAAPIVEIACVPPEPERLLVELFGNDSRGALGAVQLANGGTLLLSEIADLPSAVQYRLMELIDSRSFRPETPKEDVGFSTGRALPSIPADVRIIATTSRDIVSEVAAGRFREDLYYRLSYSLIQVPPLRARTQEDILCLAASIIREIGGDAANAPTQLSDDVQEAVLMYAWPGNIREMRNALERALIVAGESDRVEEYHLPAELRSGGAAPDDQVSRTLLEVECAHIHQVLRANKLNRTQSARALGISRATLVKKIKQFGLLAKVHV